MARHIAVRQLSRRHRNYFRPSEISSTASINAAAQCKTDGGLALTSGRQRGSSHELPRYLPEVLSRVTRVTIAPECDDGLTVEPQYAVKAGSLCPLSAERNCCRTKQGTQH